MSFQGNPSRPLSTYTLALLSVSRRTLQTPVSPSLSQASSRSLLVTPGVTLLSASCSPTQQLYYCGPGTAAPRCPAVSCSSAFASAVSGPNGCATAYSKITGNTFSSTFKAQLKSQIVSLFKDLVSGFSLFASPFSTARGRSWWAVHMEWLTVRIGECFDLIWFTLEA